MKAIEADNFDILEDQIKGVYDEFSILSKKKPDGAVNKFKLGFINELIGKINPILGTKYIPLDGFSGFDEETVPTTSDVVLLLSQYLKNMDKFRYDNTQFINGKLYWTLGKKEPVKLAKRAHLHMRA